MTASKTQFPPNDLSRRERTRKAGKCQWCEAKVPLTEQKAVFNDLEDGKVVVRKATAPGMEAKGHWCPECAEKRKAMSQRWLENRDNGGKPKAKPKAKPKTKAKVKTKATHKAKKAKPAAKRTAKPKAKAKATASDPF